jgi:hypothetical protein
VVLGLLLGFLVLAWWLIPKFYRLVRGVIRRVVGAARGTPAPG